MFKPPDSIDAGCDDKSDYIWRNWPTRNPRLLHDVSYSIAIDFWKCFKAMRDNPSRHTNKRHKIGNCTYRSQCKIIGLKVSLQSSYVGCQMTKIFKNFFGKKIGNTGSGKFGNMKNTYSSFR